MGNIDLSIVIPIYNVEKYLNRCLESIEHQVDSNVEVICIDDGSTDNGISICRAYESRIPNFKIIQQDNGGVSVARNQGIEVATGEWIWFVDPDDWIDESAIHMIREITKDSCDVVVFSFYSVWARELKRNEFGFEEKMIQLNGNCEDSIGLKESLIHGEKSYIRGYFGAVWNCLFRREYLLQHNIFFDDRLRKVQDALFNLAVLDTNPRMKFVNKALYYYFHNGSSICNKYMPNAVDVVTPVLEAIYDYIQKQDADFDNAFRRRCRITLYTILQLDILHKDNNQSLSDRKKRWKEIKKHRWFKDCLKIDFKEKMSLKNRIKLILVKANCLWVLSLYYNSKPQSVFDE